MIMLLSCLMISFLAAPPAVDAASGPPLVYSEEESLQLNAPGNVFDAGASIRIPVPQAVRERAARMAFLDEQGAPMAEAAIEDGVAVLPESPGIGWYQAVFLDSAGEALGWSTAAVLEPLAGGIVQDTLVGLDVALSWIPPDNPEARRNMARIAALSGAGWVRDRLRWRDIMPEPEHIVETSKYDESAWVQSAFGQGVLQVFHDLPKWGRDSEGVPDLRVAHAFCRDMARRFGDHVPAWEPWNEANAHNFGGWPIGLMCAWQKAAYWGFKEGRPQTIVCWHPIAGVNTPALARGIIENKTWPYFDVYTIHSYDWCHDYTRLWEHARAAAAGRPIWVTESDRGLSSPDSMPHGEIPLGDAVLKAQFIAQEYALAAAAGAERCFHFILGQYMEEHGGNRIQFGLLRADMTPRPGYVALSNLGRRLRGLRCIGAWSPDGQPNTHVVAFRDAARDVLAVWAEEPVDWHARGRCEAPWPLPAALGAPAACHDLFGRSIAPPDMAQSAAVFLSYPAGAAEKLPLTPPPKTPWRDGEPCPVVLQPHMPEAVVQRETVGWTDEHDLHVKAGTPAPFQIYAYHFGAESAEGALRGEALPDGWTMTPSEMPLVLQPGARVMSEFLLHPPAAPPPEPDDGWWVRVHGDFAKQGESVAAIRVRLQPAAS